MKITLTEGDIEELLRKCFRGIKSITIPKEFEVTMEVDSSTFSQFPITSGPLVSQKDTASTAKDSLSQEELNELERKQKVMASGGQARTLVHMG